MNDVRQRQVHGDVWFFNKEKSLSVTSFSISERISSCFVARVFLRSAKHDLDLGQFVGYGAGFRVGDSGTRGWSGVVREMEVVRVDPTNDSQTSYELTIAPSLWLLTQKRDHRIWQHKRAPEIVEQMLKDWQIDYAVELSRTYPILEYRVQYGETDYAFLSRLAEEAGFWFLLRWDSVQGKTVVVFKDKWAASSQVKVPFVESPADAMSQHFVMNVHVAHTSRPGKFTTRDFDFRRPEHDLRAEAKASADPEASWELFHFTPGGFLVDNPAVAPMADNKSTARHDDKEGARQAQDRLDAARFMKRYVDFESQLVELQVGTVFGVERHPRLDPAEPICVIESHISGTATTETRITGRAVFSSDPFRMPVTTPRPRIDGLQSAVVVGSKGEEIYTDEFGRVRVRFHWDRGGEYDDNRTCWLRCSEAFAGPGYGAATIPRVGHEVLVEFLDGNPDQPVVVGRLYSQTVPHPYKLPDEKTRSVWRTQTSPFKDNSYNELSFDDAKQNELVYVQAQRNLMRLTKQHETVRTLEDRMEVVGAHRLGVVARNDLVHFGEEHLVKIVKNVDAQVLEQKDPKYTETETFLRVKEGLIELTTGDASIVLEGGDIKIEAAKGIRFSSDRLLAMEASDIYLNCSSVSAIDPKAHFQLVDEVLSPKNFVAAAIQQLLGPGAVPAKSAWNFPPPTPEEIELAKQSGGTNEQILARKKLAEHFYATTCLKKNKQGEYEELTVADIANHVKGIDLTKPVELVGVPPAGSGPGNAEVYQHTFPGSVGQYFCADPKTTAEELGAYSKVLVKDKSNPNDKGKVVPREPKKFTAQPPPPVVGLQSTSAAINDTWSIEGQSHPCVGGGKQIMIPHKNHSGLLKS